MSFFRTAKTAIALLKKNNLTDAALLWDYGKRDYPRYPFFFDLHGMQSFSFPESSKSENERNTLVAQMSPSRRALLNAYQNSLVIRHAAQSGNDEKRRKARKAALEWQHSIVSKNRHSHPATVLMLGVVYWSNYEFDQAILEFNKLSYNDRYWPVALRFLCCCSSANSLPSEDVKPYIGQFIASDYFHRVTLPTLPVDIDTIDTEAKSNCIIALSNRYGKTRDIEDLNKARALLDSILEEQRSTAAYFEIIGNVVSSLSDGKIAIAAFQKSLELGETVGALAGLAGAYNHQERYAESLALCERALAIRPSQYSVRLAKGIALHGLGRHLEAIPYLEKAVQEQPAHILALDKLGSALIASRIDVPRGNELTIFASQMRSGKGSNDPLAQALLEGLSELI